MQLAVNIDHIATLRNARNEQQPDPVTAAAIAELSGASGIVCHLREDRRHIKDRDLERLRESVTTKLDLEMAMTEEMQRIAIRTKPELITLVPEKREELTTEGGFDIISHYDRLAEFIKPVRDAGIEVSLFIEPEEKAVALAAKAGADIVEMHTGPYSLKKRPEDIDAEIKRIRIAASYARDSGLRVVAGHGLNYYNILPFRRIEEIEEVSIGHALIARAALAGMETAVRDMLHLINEA
ncbi:MAG: pyridoxine 5'-phosphate synthase [Chlorobium phaeobacteroides]|uniref:Pyridoxine 5'-phosphate synthase n=1 Tax=Chlorobium phaeobacteroides (strain BS1) TaxID=331678 RepID=PDXJ_CHLPB|nr:RecName: Full=Pyridoxine 5'-phosphate synthase; Short=PNP synthase [Chlorobium phaeobacteroides BS1]MBL6956077.1 pyridoxine 5'-phosphate synthase [Chlorobium phaeobacteroides]